MSFRYVPGSSFYIRKMWLSLRIDGGVLDFGIGARDFTGDNYAERAPSESLVLAMERWHL